MPSSTHTKKYSSFAVPKKVALMYGLAIFSMLFGVANLLFPPVMAAMYPDTWTWAIWGFIVTDVVLTFLAMHVINQQSITPFMQQMGRLPFMLYSWVLLIGIFGLLIIPRNTSTAYELSIQPFFNMSSLQFSILYVGLAIAGCLQLKNLISHLGRILSPVLIVVIAYIIAVAFIGNDGHIIKTGLVLQGAGQSFSHGFKLGYQAVDALIVLFQVGLLHQTVVKSNTQNEENCPQKVIFWGGLIAAFLLTIVYFSLGFWGATMGAEAANDSLGTMGLLNYMIKESAGSFGSILFAIVNFVACLTTTTGMMAMISHYCEEKLKGSYHFYLILLGIVTVFISQIGFDGLSRIMDKVLTILYPSFIIIILAMACKKSGRIISLVALVSTLFALLQVLIDLNIIAMPIFWNICMIFGSDFSWLPPSLLVLLVGYTGKYLFGLSGKH